jgi:medium-chain acyl-[acyl-carrier-protein] hydrolase
LTREQAAPKGAACLHIAKECKMAAYYPNFSENFSVFRHDADFCGRMKPGALLRYAQQTAVDQNTHLGLTNDYYIEHQLAYLLARQTLHFTRVPVIDEVLRFTTVPEQSKRAANKRVTLVEDAEGKQVALVDSLWVLVNTETRRIIRRPGEEIEHFWNQEVPDGLNFLLPKAEQLENLAPRQADYLLCDLNGHINNCCYADLACASVPLEPLSRQPIRTLSIVYHREVPLGETLTLARGQAGEGWYTIGTRTDGETAFEAYCAL